MAHPHVTRRQFFERLIAAGALTLTSRPARAADRPAPGQKLGIALVGLGSYSTGQLGPALRETKFCRLAGVVTGEPEDKGRRWAQQYGFPEKNIYTYDTMHRMADNPDIDIVYVVTPNALHKEHSIAAAKAGKHVICEKPFTVSVAEADEVIAACRAAGVKLSIGYRLHFDPYHKEMMRLARDPDFGPFMKMNGSFAFYMPRKVWRAERKLAGGGPIMDLGIYVIHEACMAKDGAAPVAVTAHEGPKTRPEFFTDVEETMYWTMEFADGAKCDGMTSYQLGGNNFHAEGPHGWIDFSSAFIYNHLAAETSRGKLSFEPPVNQQALQMDDFAQCVLTGRPSIVPGEMGRRDMAIIEAIYRAAASGKREEVKA
jgi:glucose-fructose oxidoreductase